MSLQNDVMAAMKTAMKAKDRVSLESLRAIKAAIITAQTESGAKSELEEAEEIKLLQRLVKQRKDSASIYIEQNRADLAEPELAQIKVIEEFLPEQMSEEELRKIISDIVVKVGAKSPKDMGKVMGAASKEVAGKADGKAVSTMVKNILSSL
ncbi:MAG: GatB/YqeY domain-containing protein [Ichthyobacteriaceae bacterium]|nr:GatB/YqeY domain-containing protein [Ichthyobacteriaceae bacterium]